MLRASFRSLVLTGALVLSGAAVRIPHIELKRSEPARDAVLATPPTRVVLWFSARPQMTFTRVRLTGPAGDVALGKLTADTVNAARADVVAPLVAGVYHVVWQTASADGHQIAGDFTFTVGAADKVVPHQHEAAPTAPATVPMHTMHDPSLADRMVRWFEYATLLAVLGVLAFLHAVLPPLAARGVHTASASGRARAVGEVAASVYILAAAWRLLRETAAANSPAMSGGPTLTEIVTSSSWGHGWLFGVVGAVLVLPGFILSKRHVAVGVPIALTGALAMVLSPALSGHAATSALFVPSVALDALHVAAVGAWIGGLLIVLTVGIPAMAKLTDGNPDAAVSALVNSFHPLALLGAPLAILAGAGSSALRLGSINAITTTGYGRVLLVKVGLASLVAGMGAYNSMRARKRLGNPAATLSLKRSATLELVIASIVLAVTTVLVSTAVPSEMNP
jgi:copper transport protein